MKLVVNEMFDSIQGEGPSAGRRAFFLRLGRCNLDCGSGSGAGWKCDTPYTWDWRGKIGPAQDPAKELHGMTVDEVVSQVRPVGLVVITGGEPMIQQNALLELAPRLAAFTEVEIETNGTRIPGPNLVPWVTRFNVSPKLSNSGCDPHARYNPEALDRFVSLATRGKACFKFVAADVSDLDEIAVLAKVHGLCPETVWVMPAGTDADTLTARAKELAPWVIGRGWNLSGRQHVMLWGDRRGV